MAFRARHSPPFRGRVFDFKHFGSSAKRFEELVIQCIHVTERRFGLFLNCPCQRVAHDRTSRSSCFSESLPGYDSATRIPCQESSAVTRRSGGNSGFGELLHRNETFLVQQRQGTKVNSCCKRCQDHLEMSPFLTAMKISGSCRAAFKIQCYGTA